ncbi:MAG: hypothetical protein J0H82_04250 [Alphaproteobacteria bacterium]|jgi:hypothetical protein|nr:hypothetical protein [Alphaproteobacteria bacterium]
MRRFAILALLGLGLAGCGGLNTIYFTDQLPPYSPGLVGYAGQSGTLPVQLVGNPFPQPTEPEAIANAVPLPGYLPPTKPTTRPNADANMNFRLAFAFNPVNPNQSFDNLCSDINGVAVRPPNGQETVIMAAFCSVNRAIAYTEGKTGPVQSLADPAYRSLMADMMVSMLPPYDPTLGMSPMCGPYC